MYYLTSENPYSPHLTHPEQDMPNIPSGNDDFDSMIKHTLLKKLDDTPGCTTHITFANNNTVYGETFFYGDLYEEWSGFYIVRPTTPTNRYPVQLTITEDNGLINCDSDNSDNRGRYDIFMEDTQEMGEFGPVNFYESADAPDPFDAYYKQ